MDASRVKRTTTTQIRMLPMVMLCLTITSSQAFPSSEKEIQMHSMDCKPIENTACQQYLPYTMSRPNEAMQSVMDGAIQQFRSLEHTGCGKGLISLQCQMAYPACSNSTVPVLPCKSVCVAAVGECEIYFRQNFGMDAPFGNLCDQFSDQPPCNDGNVTSSGEQLDGNTSLEKEVQTHPMDCKPIENTACQQYLPYTMSRPNEAVQSVMDGAIQQFRLLEHTSCGKGLISVQCQMAYPACSNSYVPVLPCKSVCVAAVRECEIYFKQNLGIDSPFGNLCDFLPDQPPCNDGNVTSSGGQLDGNTSLEPAKPCNCSSPDGMSGQKDKPSPCVRGNYRCSAATTRSYVNGQLHCCLDGKSMSLSSSCAHDGDAPSTLCTCLYPTPPGTC